MRNLPSLTRRSLLLLAALVVPLGCSEGTPVAPSGTILRVSAYPTRISTRGLSTVTVNAYRSTGNPVNPGTEVRLSSTLGIVDAVAYTSDSGQATAQLRGDGRIGTATVSVFSGGIDPVTIDIAIGQLAASMSFQVTPSSVAETGGTLDLLALIRDDVSQPLAGAQVNFRSEVGTLESGGRFITTDADGEATDRLTVTAADLQLVGDDNFQVTAEVGGSGGSIVSRTFQVGIQRPPQAAFTFQRAGERPRRGEGSAHVAGALAPRERGLRRRRAGAHEAVPERQARRPAHGAGELARLVVAALALARGVERHRHDRVDARGRPRDGRGVREQRAERRGERQVGAVLEPLHQAVERERVEARGDGRVPGRRVREAAAADGAAGRGQRAARAGVAARRRRAGAAGAEALVARRRRAQRAALRQREARDGAHARGGGGARLVKRCVRGI